MKTLRQYGPYAAGEGIRAPTYNAWYKLLATVVTFTLFYDGITLVRHYGALYPGPLVPAIAALLGLLVVFVYHWYLRSVITIDDAGIRQTWLYRREVEWRNVRAARVVTVPLLRWLVPPRLVVLTAGSYVTFNGTSKAVLAEFERIMRAYEAR